MADEIVIEDDPTETTDDQKTDAPVQDNPPEEPAARAAFYEAQFKEERLKARELAADKKRLEGMFEDERTSKKYWEGEAKARPVTQTPSEVRKADAVDEVIEEFDLAELTVAEDGGKRLVQHVKKELAKEYKGYVKPEDVEAAIDRRLNTIVAQGKLAERFPELTDVESDFTKKVNARTVQLAKDPECEGMSQIALMRLAAAEVETENGGRARERENGNADREARIGRQSVQGRGPRQTTKPSTELTAEQKKFARIAGITEEEYAKEANAGIRTYPTLGPQ